MSRACSSVTSASPTTLAMRRSPSARSARLALARDTPVPTQAPPPTAATRPATIARIAPGTVRRKGAFMRSAASCTPITAPSVHWPARSASLVASWMSSWRSSETSRFSPK